MVRRAIGNQFTGIHRVTRLQRGNVSIEQRASMKDLILTYDNRYSKVKSILKNPPNVGFILLECVDISADARDILETEIKRRICEQTFGNTCHSRDKNDLAISNLIGFQQFLS